MKKILALVLACAMVLSLAACASTQDTAKQEVKEAAEAVADAKEEVAEAKEAVAEAVEEKVEEAAAEATDDEKLTFGYIAYNMADIWNEYSAKAFEYAAQQKGADVVILDAQNDVAQSVSCMENLIQQGVDGISIFPISGEQGAQLVQMANEAGIPITVENLDMSQYADPDSYVASVGCVYGDIGNAAIDWLAENVDDAKVFYAAGAAGGGVYEAYKEGVDAALADNEGKIELVGLQNGQDWSTENGLDMTQNFINSGKEFNCIFANNDQMAQGCHQALEAAGLDIPVVSTGGSPDAYKFLEDKIEAANMTAPVSIQGVQTFLNIYDYVKDGKTPDEKFQSLPVIPVSSDKLDEWIDWSDFAGAYDYCTK